MNQGDVEHFMLACGQPVRHAPTFPDRSEEALRADLLAEEYREYAESVKADDLVGIADALADMVYVIYGTAATYGINLDDVLDEVHRSNMTKVVNGKVLRREDGKILKPDGYEPPRIEEVIYGEDAA